MKRKLTDTKEDQVATKKQKVGLDDDDDTKLLESVPIRLNVGGHLFETTRQTLTSIPGSLFHKMFAGKDWKAEDDKKVHKFDRNPGHFKRILDYMRNGGRIYLRGETTSSLHGLYLEAEYFGLAHLQELILKVDKACKYCNYPRLLLETSATEDDQKCRQAPASHIPIVGTVVQFSDRDHKVTNVNVIQRTADLLRVGSAIERTAISFRRLEITKCANGCEPGEVNAKCLGSHVFSLGLPFQY